MRRWLLGSLVLTSVSVAPASAAPDLSLPDPLVCLDGRRVTDSQEWQSARRGELLRAYEEHVYGRSPRPPRPITFETLHTRGDALSGLATRKIVRIYLLGDRAGPSLDLLLYVPNAAAGHPVPAFLGLNYLGNQSVTAETDIPVSTRWFLAFKDVPGLKDHRMSEESRGAQARRWPLATLLSRGYAVATACYADIEEDRPEGWQTGLRAALAPQGAATVWRRNDWGAIGAWSWGLSRILDYLETEPTVDARRVALTGHSRLGKTVLWAGAQDERFALVISNDSGEGGAALARRKEGERIADSIRSFPYWYCDRYRDYVDREEALPVDSHCLISLMAPRPVYVSSATEDRWADPEGEFLAVKYAEPVFALFQRAGLSVAAWPAPDQSVGRDLGYHLRTGKHDIVLGDWVHHLDFADRHLRPAPASPPQT